MITVGILKKMLEKLPDNSPILSGISKENLFYIADISTINIIWKDKEENVIQTIALQLNFDNITYFISSRMFIPFFNHNKHLEKVENTFTPSTLIEELGKENNFFKEAYNIDKNILKMIQLKLIKNFDSLTKAYEELLEHKNRDVFGKCLDAIICKE